MIPPNPERYYLWTGSERRVLCAMLIRAQATWAAAWGVTLATPADKGAGNAKS